jgi:formylmethanofuran dehydrogenase subunit C
MAGRASHTAILMDSGTVLVAGGVRDGAGPLTSAEEYMPATGRWVPEPSMSCPRSVDAAIRLHDGTILIVGGCGTSSGAEVFRP